jgi:hypothetical protein
MLVKYFKHVCFKTSERRGLIVVYVQKTTLFGSWPKQSEIKATPFGPWPKQDEINNYPVRALS